MIRRSIALFTVLAASFAASAPLAGAAPQFMGFIEEPPPSTHLSAALAGEQTTTIAYTPEAGGATVKCASLGLPGGVKTGTDTSITVRPEPKSCSSSSSSTTDIRMNGCEYRYTVTTKLSADKYQGTMAVVCPEGQQVEMLDVVGGSVSCRQKIQPQAGLGPVYFEDKTEATPDHLAVELKVTGIKNELSGLENEGKPYCGVKNGKYTNGTMNGAFTLKGYSTKAQVEFAITGEAEPIFTAFGVVPVEGGHQAAILQAERLDGIDFRPSSAYTPIHCPKASAGAELPAGTLTLLTLSLAFSECTTEIPSLPSLLLPTTVNTNGCDQRFKVEKSLGGDEFTGKMDILCPVGKEMQIVMSNCVITVPPQEALGPVLYKVRTDVVPHDILIEPRLTTVKSKASGLLCPATGSFTNGSYFGALTLRGLAGEPLNLSFGGKEPSFEFTGAPASLPPSIFPKATTVKGAQATAHQYVPATGFSPVKCGTASLQGTLATGIGTSLSAKPTYSSCATASALTANVRLNGCEYKLRPTKLLSADKYEGVTDVLCSGGEEIEFEVTNPGGTFKCLDTIPAQEGAGPVYFEDQTAATPDDLVVNLQIANLRNRTSGGLANCGVANGEHTGGTYTGTSTARGYDAGEKQIEFQVNG